MRKTIVGMFVATGVLGGASAQAADLPRPTPVPAPIAVPSLWTGFYSGVYGGYGFDDLTATALGVNISPLPEPKGFFFGSNIGYNWQFGAFVVGLEADFSYGKIEDSVTIITLPGGTVGATSNLDYFTTARARVGYAFGNLLIYGTGGLAWAHNNATVDVVAPGFAARFFDDQDHLGWTAGGGFEYALSSRWSIKAEYLYLDLGNEAYTFAIGPNVPVFNVPASDVNIGLKVHTVKLGANFKFDFGGLFSGR
jgi:outer membrane immunogenic protein